MPVEPPGKKPPVYKLSHVVAAMAMFYVLMMAFDARGIYRWTTKLAVSERNARLQKIAEAHWARTALYGLEEPKISMESAFLTLQYAHPLLFPRKYATVQERKRVKEQARSTKAQGTLAAKLPPWSKRETMPKDAKHPRVLLAGDSIMAGIGPVIQGDVATKLSGSAIVRARVATGLSRPDVFDWRAEMRRATYGTRFDVIVLMLGTNDSQDFVEGGRIMSYGTADWVRTYERRLDELMSIACKGSRKSIWVGLPPMQSATFHRKAVRINGLARRRAARHSCFEYLPLERIIGDARGSFTSYLPIGGTLEKVRNVDGIHLTHQGGSLVSRLLMSRMHQ